MEVVGGYTGAEPDPQVEALLRRLAKASTVTDTGMCGSISRGRVGSEDDLGSKAA
jgi:hypothetical protein